MSRILVTGGAGFIGSHVVEAYLGAGHEVLAMDDLSRGKRENLPQKAGFEKADVRDEKAIERIFSQYRPEVINHHAAQVSVRDSVRDPDFDAEVNIIGGLRLLKACEKHGVKRFLFASTGGAIYGEQETFPAPESHIERPLSPYGVAKLSVERYLFFYGVQYGIKWTALRYSNVYGPRQDPHGEAGVVAIFCQRMLAGAEATINGDGGQTRDFVYVGDVARANLLALEKDVTGPINVATGVETDVNAIFRTLNQSTGANMPEKHGPPMPGEQRRSVLDPSLAAKLMGWKAKMDLTRGLGKTVEFFRNQ